MAPVKVEETRMLGYTQAACCMGSRDGDREPMSEGPGVLLWDRGGGEGAWKKRAQAAARPAFDTVLVTCDNWPTTPLASILHLVTDQRLWR